MRLAGYTVVYGGSFNPPHFGHQVACLYLLEALGAQNVLVLPTNNHPFGKALEPFEHRLAMCELLAAPFAERVRVDPLERQLGGEGKTYDTLRHLQEKMPQANLALAIGADILSETHAWYRWAEIERMLPVVVLGRAGFVTPAGASDVPPLELPAVSSTEIRARLHAGESVEGLLPASVSEYISQRGLYRG